MLNQKWFFPKSVYFGPKYGQQIEICKSMEQAQKCRFDCSGLILDSLCELIGHGSFKPKRPGLYGLIGHGSFKPKRPGSCELIGLVPITTFVARASRWRIEHYVGVFFQKRNSNKTFLRNSLGWFQCVARPDDVFDIDVT